MSEEQSGDSGSGEVKDSGGMGFHGDQTFLRETLYGTQDEAGYSGALSFGRRRYTHDLRGVDVAILGVPADLTVSNRPGCRFGPRSIRAASAHLSWGEAWPWGFDPFRRLAAVDVGDVVFEPGYVESMIEATEQRAAGDDFRVADNDRDPIGCDACFLLDDLRAHEEDAVLHNPCRRRGDACWHPR